VGKERGRAGEQGWGGPAAEGGRGGRSNGLGAGLVIVIIMVGQLGSMYECCMQQDGVLVELLLDCAAGGV
jgi:hypothetical protein